MTIKEAEEMYKYCGGDEGYIMWHEFGTKKTREYSNVIIPNDLKAQWDRDIIESNLATLESLDNTSSNGIASVLSAMDRGFCNPLDYADRLLGALEKMMKLNPLEKVHVIRNMGQRETQFHSSGIEVFRKLGDTYLRRMDAIMRRFMDFECPDEPAANSPKAPSKLKLYREAVSAYNENIRKKE